VQDFDPDWLLKARDGDVGAFTHIVETFQKPVYSLCYRMLGNAQDAEDAAQETFIRAYKSILRYDQNRSFSTWLLSIAAHYCIDQIRKARFKLISIEDLTVPDVPDKEPGVEFRINRKEEREKIRGLLEVLSPTDRACVVMYYWHDFSYDEICTALSLSSSAVKSRLHRARRAMARQWKDNMSESLIMEGMVS
jgi:RNA polymerase sigma-70 factor (ECF subfamily)